MAEESTNLTQRVEALEQISHARVVERVGQIEQRVSRIESAREAEEPHVATKADIARLETRIAEAQTVMQGEVAGARSSLQEQLGETRAELGSQIAETKSDLEDRIGDAELSNEKQLRHFLMWMIGTAIALTAVIIAAAASIVTQLS